MFDVIIICCSCSLFISLLQEGLRFFIYFRDHQEYELEADSLEEKEKVCILQIEM